LRPAGEKSNQARHKDLVKVMVKFVRRGTVKRKREALPVLHAGNESKDSNIIIFNNPFLRKDVANLCLKKINKCKNIPS
jgi:hypothetical protein